MNRRSYLGTAGTSFLTLLAGCSANVSSHDTGGTNTESTRPESDENDVPTPAVHESHQVGDTVETDIGEVTVEEVTVQKSVIDRGAFRILHREEGVQYLLIEAGEAPPDFVPVFDEYAYEPAAQRRPTGPDTAYILGVDIERPAPGETAAIALEDDPDIRWTLPEPTVERLVNRPKVRVRDATVTEQDGEGAFVVELENNGDRDGVFRGILISPVGADVDEGVRIDVPRGETVIETVQNQVTEHWGPDYELGDVAPEQRTFGEGG